MDELSPRGADSPALWTQSTPLHLTAEQVYHTYGPRIYHVARRMLRCEDDAEDVTQEVLLQVVRKLPTFRGEAAFPTWLHRVTVNAALAHRRKRTTHTTDDESWLETGQSPRSHRRWTESADSVLIDAETQQRLAQAIAELPPLYREVFVLADLEDLPNAEVATRLGLSLPAVKSRLHRAREMLRLALASDGDDH